MISKLQRLYSQRGAVTAVQLELGHALEAPEAAQISVVAHADEDYRERFIEAVQRLAGAGREFCADDVRELAGDPPAGTSPNIAGALLAGAAKRGLVHFVGYTRSHRLVGHGNRVCLYRGGRAG